MSLHQPPPPFLRSVSVLLGLALTACGSGGGGGGTDVVAPSLVAFEPGPLAELVPLGSTVSVTFDEEIDVSSLTTNTFVLEVNGARLGAILFYDARTATLRPSAPLPGGADVTARLTTGVRDVSGNPLGGPVEWTFSTPHASFAFAANADDGTVSSLRVDERGVLTHASVVAPAGAPSALALHRNGRWVYVLLATGESLATYELEPASGTLTLVDPPVPTGRGPSALALTPNGRFAYVTNQDDDSVSLFELDPLHGEALPAGVLATGLAPIDLEVEPRGRHLVVACRATRELVSYSIDGASGALQLVGSFALPVAPTEIAIDPTGRFLYVASANGQSLGALALSSTGSLSEVQVLPMGADRPVALALDPAGRRLYAAFEGGTLGAFRVDPGTGMLFELGTRLAVGAEPRALAVDPAGTAVHVACFGGNELVSFTLEPSTGVPSESSRLLARRGPIALAFAPGVTAPPTREARSLLVPLSGSDQLATLSVEATTGQAFVTDAFTTGDEPTAVAVDPRGRFVVLSHSRADELALHALDAVTGAVEAAPLDREPVGDYPYELALSLDGRFVVAVNLASGELTVARVDADAGMIEVVEHEAVPGSSPSQLAFDPSGSLVFMMTTDPFFPSILYTYALEPARGGLSLVGTLDLGVDGIDLAIDPRGRYLFVAHAEGQAGVLPFRIDPASGALVPLTPFVTGDMPGGLAVDPLGRALYVTGNTMGIVSGFALERGTDTFPSLGAFAPVGARPFGFAIEPNGRFGFVANTLTHEVRLVSLDATGLPTSTGDALSVPMSPIGPAFVVGP